MDIKKKLAELDNRDLLSEFTKVCRRFGVLPEQVFSADRSREVSSARKVWATYLRDDRGWGWSSIGRLMDRDHSTIMKILKPRPVAA